MFVFKLGLTTSVAITSTSDTTGTKHKWKPEAPEIITINPLRMKQYKLAEPEFNEERIQKSMHPRFWQWLKLRVPQLLFSRIYRQVDLLDTPALTMLHEVGNRSHEVLYAVTRLTYKH
jgi:hypothetical protein